MGGEFSSPISYLNWEYTVAKEKIEDNTFLSLKTKIKDFEITQHTSDFRLHAGLYEDHDGYEQFGIVVVDRRKIFDEPKKYEFTFAAGWCPEKQQEWLMQVLTRQMAELIKGSHEVTMQEFRKNYGKLTKLIGL